MRRRLGEAFNHPDPDQGLTNARRLAGELDKTYPDAASSIREGLEEMFTVRRRWCAAGMLEAEKSFRRV